jgi:hypothetical protein
MQGRASSIVAIAALAVVSLAGPARAAAIPSPYRLTPLGRDIPSIGTSVDIDEEGNVRAFVRTSAGEYRRDWVQDPTDPSRTLEALLLKPGSDVNLLPEPLRSPLKATILDINASGGVVGNYSGMNAGSFYYNVETKELVDLKSLPGESDSTTQVYGMNDLGQLVGTAGGKATFYASPEAVPVELLGLLADADGWDLIKATDINNRGEIVGYANRAVMDDGYYGTGYYKLEPEAVPVPEPSSIVVFAALGLIGAGFSVIGHKRRSERAFL